MSSDDNRKRGGRRDGVMTLAPASVPMPIFRSRTRAVAFLALAWATSAGAVTCEWAVRFTTDIVDYGERARKSDDFLIARRTANDTRAIAVDAAREAKACGCPEAITHLEDVGRQALRAGNAQDLTAAQQYAKKIKDYGEETLAALQKCP